MTDQQVKKLYQEFHLPKHIQKHCIQVAKVAIYIGTKINIDLAHLRYAALLHDLLRMCDISKFDPDQLKNQFAATESDIKYWQKLRQKYANTPHWLAAKIALEDLNEPDIEKIISTHDFLSINQPDASNRTLEQKILYYADKRVCHHQITSLQHRLEEGMKRYIGAQEVPASTLAAIKKCQELEQEICRLAQINPSDITPRSCDQLSALQ